MKIKTEKLDVMMNTESGSLIEYDVILARVVGDLSVEANQIKIDSGRTGHSSSGRAQ